MELLRSLIFVPGNRRDMLEKARGFDADAVVVDLEDSVPPDEKVNARDIAREMTPTLPGPGRKVIVRLNSLDTGLTKDELSAVISPHLYGISVGKVDSPWDIKEYDHIATVAEREAQLVEGQLKLIPWLESAKAILRAYDIATASSRVLAVAVGAEDYTNDMSIRRTTTGEEVYLPRAMVAMAAHAAEVVALDAVYVRFRDEEGLVTDIDMALKLGYKGKFAIHPSQLETINRMFSPSEEELAYARRVMEVWDEAETKGKGSASLDGVMIDVPVMKRARNLLTLADTISQSR